MGSHAVHDTQWGGEIAMPECPHGLEADWCTICRTEPVTTVRGDDRDEPPGFPVRIGEARMEPAGSCELEGETIRGRADIGFASIWRMTVGDHQLDVAYVRRNGGERNVQAEHVRGPEDRIRRRLERLMRGQRLEVQRKGSERWVSLMYQSVIDPENPNWAGKRKADQRLLEDGAGIDDPRQVLLDLGARAVGPRNDLIGRARGGDALCVTFDFDNELVPVAAYTISRILPIYRGYVA